MTKWLHLSTVFSYANARLLIVPMVFIVAISTTIFLSVSASAAPGINKTVGFQGRLQRSSGAVVPDGYYNIQFKIYQDGAGDVVNNPGGDLKWTESHVNDNGTSGVRVKNGYFSVDLGSKTAFGNDVDWNQDTLWLSMNVAGTASDCTTFNTGTCIADGEMLPMKRLTATPFAINSSQLDGKTADKFVQIGQGVQADASDNSSIFINKTGAGDLIQLQSGATDVFTVGNNGSLTLGSAANQSVSVAENSTGPGRDLTLSAGSTNAIDSNGGDLILQSGSGNGAGDDGKIVMNSNVSVGAGKTISMVGGATSLRPTSPAAGDIYFDTDTNQLLTYNGTKWMSDKNSSTRVVAASNSPQSVKDSADYVADNEAVIGTGAIDGDQIEINQAINSLPDSGGNVYLPAGKYYLDDSIVLPSNVTLSGAGSASILTVNNSIGASIVMVTNSDTINGNTDIKISDLKLDGNYTNTVFDNYISAIKMTNVGTKSKSGITITSNFFDGFRSRTIDLNNISSSVIQNNSVNKSSKNGLHIKTGHDIRVTNNTFNELYEGVYLDDVDGLIFSSNRISADQEESVDKAALTLTANSDYNRITNNTFSLNSGVSIQINGSKSNQVSNNSFVDNGGDGGGDTEGPIVFSSLSFEGQTADTAPSLSGDWSMMGSSNATVSEAAAVHGDLGIRWLKTDSYEVLNYTGPAVSEPTLVTDFYITPRQISQNTVVATIGTSSNTISQVRIMNDLTVQIRDGLTATDTSTQTLNLNTTYRFSWSNDSTVQSLRVYEGESSTPLFTLNGSYSSTEPRNYVRIGVGTASQNTSFDIDTIRISDALLAPYNAMVETFSIIKILGDSDSNTISDNLFREPGGGGGAAVHVSSSASNTTISNNSLGNTGTGADYFDDDSDSTVYTNQADASGKIVNRSDSGFSVQDRSGASALTIEGDTGDVKVAGSLESGSLATASVDTAAAGDLLIGTSNATSVTIGTADTKGTTLVLDSKTSSGDPTGTNGAMYYNSSAGAFRCYQAGSWRDCITPLPIYKTTASDTAFDNTETDINDLDFNLAANTKYHYKFVIKHDTVNDNEGAGFGITSPSGSTGINWCVNTTVEIAATTPGPSSTAYCGTGDVSTVIDGSEIPGEKFVSVMEGYIETGSNSGNLQLRALAEGVAGGKVLSSSFGIVQIVQ